MPMHLVIGKGNLGIDIQIALKDRGISAEVMTKSEGFNWPAAKPGIIKSKYECIWIAAGRGSVEACTEAVGLQDALEAHTYLPISMALSIDKDTPIVAFSSDYAADESDMSCTGKTNQRPKSMYACTKIWMEQGLIHLKRPNTAIIRVGSLYGSHFPEKCFPGKLKLNNPRPGEVLLPQNIVTPTPTAWAGKMLVQGLGKMFSDQGTTLHHLAPMGNIPIVNWGRRILGEKYVVSSRGFDKSRPSYSALGCSLGRPNVTWEELWTQYERVQSVASPRKFGL